MDVKREENLMSFSPSQIFRFLRSELSAVVKILFLGLLSFETRFLNGHLPPVSVIKSVLI